MWQNTDDRRDAEYDEWLAEIGRAEAEYESRIAALGWTGEEIPVPTFEEVQADPLFQMMVGLMQRPMQ